MLALGVAFGASGFDVWEWDDKIAHRYRGACGYDALRSTMSGGLPRYC